MTDSIDFTLDDKAVSAEPGETIWQVAEREGIDIPHLCYSPATSYRADGNCRVCMVEIEGERVLAASCIRTPTPDMVVNTATERAGTARKMVMELLLADQPAKESAHDPQSELWHWADQMGQLASRFPGARRAAGRPEPPGDGGQPGCLHPLYALRARLPRGAGQRRHRHGVSWAPEQDRLRLRRSDGHLDLRRLRRVRPGLPDRRADAGDAVGRGRPAHRLCRPPGRQRLPLLRRRLPDYLQHQGQRHPPRRGPRGTGQPWPAVRQGPLRLRLHQAPAPPDDAADPQGGHAEGRLRRHRSGQSLQPLPRGELGRGARFRRRGPGAHPRSRRRQGARRLRLGQGVERRSLSGAEAGARRLRHQQRRPLHAAVSRLVGRRTLGDDRLGRGDGAVHRRAQGRRHHRHRRQPEREPSGRRDLLQERGQGRRHADRLRPARPRAKEVRDPHAALQAGLGRRSAERDDERHRRRRALRPPVRRGLHRGLRGDEGAPRGVHARGDGADLWCRRGDHSHGGADLRARRGGDHLLGHGHLAEHPRHR